MSELKWFTSVTEATKLSCDYDDSSYASRHNEGDFCLTHCYEDKQFHSDCKCECHHELYQQQQVIVYAENQDEANEFIEKMYQKNDTESFKENHFKDFVMQINGDSEVIHESEIPLEGFGKMAKGTIFLGNVVTTHEAWN
jgi:hypothetical protein